LWNQSGYKNIVAVDISREVVEYCKRVVLEEVILVPKLQDFLIDHKELFDLITMLDVIEHIRKDEIIEVCSLIRNSLKLHGRIIMQTPNIGGGVGALRRYDDFTHEIGFTEHSISQVLKTAGFKNIEVYGFEQIIARDLKSIIRKLLRDLFLYPTIKLVRKIYDINCMNILHSNLFVTATR